MGRMALVDQERASVTAQSVPIEAALDGIRRVQFEAADIVRRAQGRTLQAVGFGPDECPYRAEDGSFSPTLTCPSTMRWRAAKAETT